MEVRRCRAGFLFPIVLIVCGQCAARGRETDPVRRMTALRAKDKILIDGRLDEPDWKRAEPATDFIQRLPFTGEPATERTEARVLYDEVNLYVGAHCFDSEGERGITLKDIKRDFMTLHSDGFQVVLDTFDDNLNSFLFGTNPDGALFDMQIGGDGAAGNTSWNGIWQVKTTIDSQGWHVEMAIPLKTLRFPRDHEQAWGINFERRVRRKSEDSYWSPLPAAFRLGRVSLAGVIDGLQDIEPGRNLYIKPYVSTPVQHAEGDDVDFKPTAGFDVKYGVRTQSTLDLTVHTDFAQVEADEVQINLTRYNLFFPEKREFFLENAGLFGFGRSRVGGYRQDMIPFFSRRIGLSLDRRLISIYGGGRLTGRTGRYTVGLLSMQTEDFESTPATNFSVARVRRDLFRKSDVGGIFISKWDANGRNNLTYGADVNFRLLRYLELSSFLLKTDTPELKGKDVSANAEVAWRDDLFDVEARYFTIGKHFNPEVGFVSRSAMRQTSGIFALTPRPGKRIPWIRQLGPTFTVNYITDPQGTLETRAVQGSFDMILTNSAEFSIGGISNFERLAKPFYIRPSLPLPPGDYSFGEFFTTLKTDKRRLFNAEIGVNAGSFWNGNRLAYRGALEFQPGFRFSAGVTWNHNDVDLPGGAFQTDLWITRLRYSFATNLFLNALIQYNSDTREVSSNLRFNFTYKPLSDLFIVYNERRSSTGEVIERALIAKLTYVLAF